MGRVKDSTCKTSTWMAWAKLKGFSTVRARLAHGWLGHNTCKTSLFFAVNPFKIQAKHIVSKSQIFIETSKFC